MNIDIEITPEDANQLVELLLDRPHREQWSNRVLMELVAALEEFMSLRLVDDE